MYKIQKIEKLKNWKIEKLKNWKIEKLKNWKIEVLSLHIYSWIWRFFRIKFDSETWRLLKIVKRENN